MIMCIKQIYVFAVAESVRPKDEATTNTSSVPKGQKTESQEKTDKCTCLIFVFNACVIFTMVTVQVS